MLRFVSLDPRVRLDDAVGMIPMFLLESDPRRAVDQINERYAHGGGWRDAKVGDAGWRPIGTFSFPESAPMMKFPGDPPLHPLALGVLHGEVENFGDSAMETIVIYESGWTAVFQNDGSFRFARLD